VSNVGAVMVVGLTGGVGAGKSTVAAALARRGAYVLSADMAARQLMEPGEPALAAAVAAFGPDILGADGTLDRAALARIVFADEQSRRTLERITHPLIRARLLAAAARYDGPGPVVLEVPLLDAQARDAYGLDAVVVVDAPVDTAVARVVADRRWTEQEARSRVAAQITRQERLALADWVIANDDDLPALEAEVDRLWSWLGAGAPGPAPW
jgi:dephospho-CoA kinase